MDTTYRRHYWPRITHRFEQLLPRAIAALNQLGGDSPHINLTFGEMVAYPEALVARSSEDVPAIGGLRKRFADTFREREVGKPSHRNGSSAHTTVARFRNEDLQLARVQEAADAVVGEMEFDFPFNQQLLTVALAWERARYDIVPITEVPLTGRTHG